MAIYFLLFIIVMMTAFAYLLSHRDIMAPSVLLCCGYLIACISCIMNIEKWGVNLHFNTCAIILVGVIFFVLGDAFSRLFFKDRLVYATEMPATHTISVSMGKVFLFSVFSLFVMVLYFREIISIAGGMLATFNQTMYAYRHAYSYTDVQVSSTLVQLTKFSKGAAYAFLYIFFNNIFVVDDRRIKQKILQNIRYLIPTLLFLLQTFLKGGRLNLIMMVVAGLFLGYFQWHRNVGWNRAISGKFLKHIIVFFILFVLLFYGTKELVGRQNNDTLLDYITTYFGGSFQLLDQYMNTPRSTNLGMESFPGIFQSLYKLGIYNDYIHKSLEFRTTPTGIFLGNIYTGLRRFYNDFGYVGLIGMQFLYGFIFEGVYTIIRKFKTLNINKVFLITAYDTMLFAVVTQAMEDHFWIDIGLGYVIELAVFWVCIKYIFEYKVTFDGKIKRRRWNSYVLER